MKKNIIKLALLATPVLFVVQTGLSADTTKTQPASPATGEEINWQVISSGGSNATSNNFWLRGTVGQTAVGTASSGSFNLSHGFWQDFGCCRNRGDCDGNGHINVADLTCFVCILFQGCPLPSCEEEGDVDGSGAFNIADLTYMVAYLFQGGSAPPPC